MLSAVRVLALTLFCLAALPSASQSRELHDANTFTLSSHHIHITYTTAGIDGRPQLDYNDSHSHLHFAENDVITETALFGTLVSAVVRRHPVQGMTLFTVLLPLVRVAAGDSVQVHTMGFVTIHVASILPQFDRGQRDLYTFTPMTGTARYVVF